MTVSANPYIAKKVHAAWKEYLGSFADDWEIQEAPPHIQKRWAMLEPMLEHAFKHGAAAGGIIGMELLNSVRNS